MAANAFFHRGPIRDPVYFFGRKDETAHLFDLLNRGQSVSISGQRRLGKTSLLFYISTPEIAANHGMDPNRTRWVYLEGGMFDDLDEDAIYGEIDRGIQASRSGDIPYELLIEHLRDLAVRNLRLIIIMDEFEIITQNSRFQPRMFNRLRGLAAQFPVQFVIASRDPLARLAFANPAVVSSSFFNIFASLRLSLFDKRDALELLESLSERGGAKFKSDTNRFILELVGPHPHFLQVAGYHAFEFQRDGALSADARSVVRERVKEELEGHLEYYWRNLTGEEKYVLASLPQAVQECFSATLARLADSSLIVENRYLGSVLQDFVMLQSVPGLLCHSPILMDEHRRLVTVNGNPVHLTPTEYAALRLFLQNPGRLIVPEEIEASLWPGEFAPDPERAKGIMKKLRNALGEAGQAIVTQRGQGYTLV